MDKLGILLLSVLSAGKNRSLLITQDLRTLVQFRNSTEVTDTAFQTAVTVAVRLVITAWPSLMFHFAGDGISKYW